MWGIGTGIAVGGALAGAGAIIGGNKAADAATSAGQAQLAAAQAQIAYEQTALNQQIAERQRITAQAVSTAQISPGEASSIGQILSDKSASLNASLASINQQQTLLNNMDPNTKLAGQNLYNLMSGQAASALAPYQAQIDRQRASLVSNLQSQLGPGYATSSAGIEALSRFDAQSSLSQAQVQQSYLNTFGGIYGNLTGQQNQAQSTITGQTQNAFAAASASDAQVLQANQNIQNRITNATLGAASASPINFQGPATAAGNVIPIAGNAFAGQQIAGNAIAGAAGALGSGFATAGVYNAFANRSPAAPPGGNGFSLEQINQIQNPQGFNYQSQNFGTLGGNAFATGPAE